MQRAAQHIASRGARAMIEKWKTRYIAGVKRRSARFIGKPQIAGHMHKGIAALPRGDNVDGERHPNDGQRPKEQPQQQKYHARLLSWASVLPRGGACQERVTVRSELWIFDLLLQSIHGDGVLG